MDKGWTQLPLFVIFLLFLSNTHGFKAGAHSGAHHWWGQPSDKTFSPRAVQSSGSEVPVTGILPEEVGSGLFSNRPLKRLNLLKFVKGGVSSRHESMSQTQTAPSRSVLASLPLNERDAGHLTSLQGSSGSSATDTNSVSTQGQSSFPATLGNYGLSTSDQSSPSLYMSSSLETSGAKSTEATLPEFSQESISYSSLSAPGATYTSQGSLVLASEGSGQSIFPQSESSYSGLPQSQGASGQYNPGSHNVLSSSSVSSLSTSDQSTPSLYSSSFQGSSGSLLEASGSFQGEVAGMGSHVDLSPQSQDHSNQLLPSPLEVSSLSTNGQSTPSLFKLGSESSSDSQSAGPASPLDIQGGLTQSISSQPTGVQSSPSVSSAQSMSSTQLTSSNFLPVQGGSSTSSLYLKPQVTLGQFASGSPSSYPSVSHSLPQGSSPQGSSSQSATAQSSQKQFASSYGTQLVSSKPFTLQGSTTYGGSLQPQGTISQFASGSPSSYPSASLSQPQGSSSQSATAQTSRKQFASSYGTQSGTSKPLTLQGSTTYGGSLQPQGSTSQFASGSPSSYPSASLSQPQGSSSQSTTAQTSRKQFASSYGTQSGTSKPLTLQGSTTYGGSLQPQGTISQFASGSPFSYPSASLSQPQGSSSQSATVQSSQQFASSFGTQSGTSKPFTLQGSTTYGGSLQPQGTTSQFASWSPSSYPSVSLSSPQGASSQSATALQPSSFGTQLVSSKPLTLQGSTTYGGSLQPQGTTSPFASGSPSYPSASLSQPQGSSSQSATAQSSWKQFASSYGTQSGTSKPFTLQGSTTYGGSLQPQGTTSQFASGSPSYPSALLSSPQGSSSQSATALQPSSFGTQLVSSKPLTLQGSTTYGGSLQPQGTIGQFASGSPSYPSALLSSPQGSSSQSATAQSSRKQFASSYGNQLVSSKPLTLQGSTTYGGSLQPQGTTSQFASGSPSSYPSVSLSSPQGASSQSATAQSSWKQFASSFGTQLVSSKPLTLQGSTTYGGSLQPQATTSQFASGSPSYPSALLSSPQGSSSQSATAQSSWKQFASSYGNQLGSSKPLTLQGSTTYGGSLQPQGTTSQFASGSPSSYPSASLSQPLGSSSQSATAQTSRKQFASSYGTQSGTSKPFTLQGSTTYGGSLQPQGTTSQFASGSPSSYPSVSLSSPQGASSQSATALQPSSFGTQLVSSKPLTLQGSTTYGGSLQPQGTIGQFASGSPSYPSALLSSPQGSSSQSATAQSSRKQFASSYGNQLVSSKPLTLQGSTTYGGSLQPQGTTSQFASGSPSSYPSVSPSSPQGASSQSATAQSSWKQFASSFGTQLVSSKPLTLQGSTTYGGSLQPQATTSQFASGSPSYYPSASLSLPQGSSSQSATAQTSRKQFASSYGNQLVSSKPFTLQGSTTYGGSLQPQGTTSQFASGSPSYPSVSLFSPQGASSQSATAQSSQKQLTSTFTGNSGTQEGPSYYPSASLSSPQGASSQSAAFQSSRKQFASSITERPSRFSSQAPYSASSYQISEHFGTMQHPTGSNLTPSLGLSAQPFSFGMFSGIPQTAHSLRESGSDVQLYNQRYSVKG